MTERNATLARELLTPRWIITTLLVIAALMVMARLGFWQLERLEERRAFNTAVQAQLDAPALDLNQGIPTGDLPAMEYREVVARGEFDPGHEIILRNQIHDNRPGYHLLTPLRIDGTDKAVLVDRGFIPMEEAQPAERAQYARPGAVTIQGRLRQGHVPRIFGARDPELAPGQERLDAWNAVNLPRIQEQVPYELLPVYIQAAPDPGEAASGPIAAVDIPDITEGSHLGYAFQWFSFAAILAIGYPFFVRKQLRSLQPTKGGKQ